jgi:hypothetical protein
LSEYISRSEAKARGLKTYYDGKKCKRLGHDSQRYVVNGACVTCQQEQAARRHDDAADEKSPRRKGLAARLQKPIAERLDLSEPERTKVLEAFAVTRKLADGAAAVGLTEPQLTARLAANPGLEAAIRKIGVKAETPPDTASTFEWTDAKRAALIEKFVDTGDIATARDSVGVTPSVYQRELESNADFARAVADAKPLAMQHLKERAVKMALAGNDKVLTAVLKAEFPEFRDSLKLDVNHSVKSLSDAELDRKLERLRGRIIDAQFTEVPQLTQTAEADALDTTWMDS